jgi:hypothetical protein
MAVQSIGLLCEEILITGEVCEESESFLSTDQTTLNESNSGSSIPTNSRPPLTRGNSGLLPQHLSSASTLTGQSNKDKENVAKISISENINVYLELAKQWKSGNVTGNVFFYHSLRCRIICS